jgi:hypothetical protein
MPPQPDEGTMKKRTAAIALAVIIGLLSSSPARGEPVMSDLLILGCNTDGSYLCGSTCRGYPAYGRWCCEM